MKSTEVVYDLAGPAAFLTINREQARNALNPQVMREILQLLERARDDSAARVVVLTGQGEKAFSAGGDLGGMSADGALAQHFDRAQLSAIFRSMRHLGKPVIARVNGHALGGGFGLMLGCDLVVAAEHAEVGTPEINVGLWPYIITSVIQRNIPPKIALEMMMLGKRIPAIEAQALGFVNQVVPAHDLNSAVEKLVEELASKSSAILRLGKDSFYSAMEMDFDSALAYLESQLTIGLSTEDAVEGVTAFVQKRTPDWKHR